jgi:surface polysaccharide O-acyltransferase-like enzyme
LHYAGAVKFLVNYISEGLAAISVPLLFLLAGYLFFYGCRPSAIWFSRNILKRGRTLLVPLLFWNLVCLAVTAVAQANPATAIYFSGRSTPVASFRALDYLNAIVGVTSHPIAYQFWFIRDLIVLAILSPAIYFLLTTIPGVFFLLLGIRWFSSSAAWTIPFLSREAALFFCIGSALAIRRVDLSNLDKWTAIAFAYLPLSILDALAKGSSICNSVHKTAELFGVAFVFCATRYLWRSPVWKRWLLVLSPASFFVFATHEPLLTVVRKLCYVLWPPSSATRLAVLYFANPLLVIAVCTSLYFVLVTTMPLFVAVITGGRSRGRQITGESHMLQGAVSAEVGI